MVLLTITWHLNHNICWTFSLSESLASHQRHFRFCSFKYISSFIAPHCPCYAHSLLISSHPQPFTEQLCWCVVPGSRPHHQWLLWEEGIGHRNLNFPAELVTKPVHTGMITDNKVSKASKWNLPTVFNTLHYEQTQVTLVHKKRNSFIQWCHSNADEQ